jgi:rod shape-determining protein MreC
MAGPKNLFFKHKTRNTFILLFLFSILLLLFSGSEAIIKPKEIVMDVFSFFQGAVKGVSNFTSNTVNSINELRQLQAKYEDLEQQIEDFQNLTKDIQTLEQENTALREQLEFKEALPYDIVVSEIIGKDPSNYVASFVINKGTRDGIERGLPVIAYQDGIQGLVGRVVEAGLASSKVLPIIDTSSFVAARLQRSRFEGLVIGSGRRLSRLSMQYVVKHAESEINPDDLVITSGYSAVYPKDIVIGKVKQILGEDWEATIELEIDPAIDFSRLEYVLVLRNK